MLIVVLVNGQTTATTEDGKKVILTDDGTWEYMEIDHPSESIGDLTCESLCEIEEDKMTDKSYYRNKVNLVVSQDGENGFERIFMKSKDKPGQLY